MCIRQNNNIIPCHLFIIVYPVFIIHLWTKRVKIKMLTNDNIAYKVDSN